MTFEMDCIAPEPQGSLQVQDNFRRMLCQALTEIDKLYIRPVIIMMMAMIIMLIKAIMIMVIMLAAC